MKKIIISIILITNLLNAKDSNLTNLTEDELMAKLIELEEQIQEEKAKTKAVKKLGKTVDELAKQLGI